jgi:hypothetical protein
VFPVSVSLGVYRACRCRCRAGVVPVPVSCRCRAGVVPVSCRCRAVPVSVPVSVLTIDTFSFFRRSTCPRLQTIMANELALRNESPL